MVCLRKSRVVRVFNIINVGLEIVSKECMNLVSFGNILKQFNGIVNLGIYTLIRVFVTYIGGGHVLLPCEAYCNLVLDLSRENSKNDSVVLLLDTNKYIQVLLMS